MGTIPHPRSHALRGSVPFPAACYGTSFRDLLGDDWPLRAGFDRAARIVNIMPRLAKVCSATLTAWNDRGSRPEEPCTIPEIGSAAHVMNTLSCTMHVSLRSCVVQFSLFTPCAVNPITGI